jgi:hypothetical protein
MRITTKAGGQARVVLNMTAPATEGGDHWLVKHKLGKIVARESHANGWVVAPADVPGHADVAVPPRTEANTYTVCMREDVAKPYAAGQFEVR